MTRHQRALLYAMFATIFVDGHAAPEELHVVRKVAETLPVFASITSADLAATYDGYRGVAFQQNTQNLPAVMAEIMMMIDPQHVHMAYALACEIVVADGCVQPAEQQVLLAFRTAFGISERQAKAYERSAVQRYRRPALSADGYADMVAPADAVQEAG